jgi:putative membrane-bound dehydrogenase-like protein
MGFNPSRRWVVFTFVLLSSLSNAQPLSPEESLSRIEIEEGFRAELFASEPNVVDPVAMTFDEYGRVFVAEMREMEVLPALEPGTQATIRLLEDTDGDGRIDKGTVFAEGLSFPSGLAPFDGGLFVLCTPDLLFLRDNTGDGIADEKEVILTGFAQGNAEHRFNNLTWAADNWIYAANGHGGGKVFDPKDPDSEPLDLTGRDFRFNPWTGEFESVSRQVSGGYGLTFDDWGRRFVCHNEIHAMHVILPENYLKRNLNLAVREMGENISADGLVDSPVYPISSPQDWRIERTTRRAATMADSFRETQLRANGYFTASCGVTVYRADLFPPSHQGSLFVCDAAQNLVHRDLLTENGVSMLAARADEGTEFLRSSDQWFRPVNLCLGPEGALYVVDFYREIIETGASIPEDIQAKIDLRAGHDRGRIYRIVPEKVDSTYQPIRLYSYSSKELVPFLGHPNAWLRQTAQRLLIQRDAQETVPLLRKMVSESETPHGKYHALWALEGLGSLDVESVQKALEDTHPRIRENAIRLSEGILQPVR